MNVVTCLTESLPVMANNHSVDMLENRRVPHILAIISTTLIVAAVWKLWVGAYGFRNPITAFLTNWLVMAWIATLTLSIRLPLPSDYYDIRTCERRRIYEQLGIRAFKKVVSRGPLSIFSRTLRLTKRNPRSALQHLDYKVRRAEAIHVCSFLAILPFIIYSVLRGWADAAGWLLLFGVLVHGYPVMLQRYHRIRLQKLLTKEVSTTGNLWPQLAKPTRE